MYMCMYMRSTAFVRGGANSNATVWFEMAYNYVVQCKWFTTLATGRFLHFLLCQVNFFFHTLFALYNHFVRCLWCVQSTCNMLLWSDVFDSSTTATVDITKLFLDLAPLPLLLWASHSYAGHVLYMCSVHVQCTGALYITHECIAPKLSLYHG